MRVLMANVAMLTVACSGSVVSDPKAEDGPARQVDEKGLPQKDRFIADLRERERQAENFGIDPRAAEFRVTAGARVNIFTGALDSDQPEPSGQTWPTFKVCRATDADQAPVTLVVGPIERLGPQHPGIRRLAIAPGACHFVSGPIIEAVGLPSDFAALPASSTGDAALSGAAILRATIVPAQPLD